MENLEHGEFFGKELLLTVMPPHGQSVAVDAKAITSSAAIFQWQSQVFLDNLVHGKSRHKIRIFSTVFITMYISLEGPQVLTQKWMYLDLKNTKL